MATSDIFNLTEPIMIDDGIKRFEYSRGYKIEKKQSREKSRKNSVGVEKKSEL